MRGTIHWYDERSREGMLRLADGSLVYFHGTALAIPNAPIKSGTPCNYELIEDTTFRQPLSIKV